MKKLLFLLLLFSTLNSYGQEVPLDFQEINVENLEVNKCYFSMLIDEKESENQILERPFILTEYPHKYERVEVTLLLKDFKSQFETDKFIKYRTSPIHSSVIKRGFDHYKFDTVKNPDAFAFCYILSPVSFEMISEEDFKDGSLKIIEERLISESKIIKTYVDKRPDNLKENASFFQGGYWSSPKELEAHHNGCGGYIVTQQIQQKLVELGYELEVNNILDEKTKSVMIQFQRKNGFEEGRISKETLDALKIKY